MSFTFYMNALVTIIYKYNRLYKSSSSSHKGHFFAYITFKTFGTFS